jgi:hypothetical protein
VGLIEDLIELNRQRAGEAQDRISGSEFRFRRKREPLLLKLEREAIRLRRRQKMIEQRARRRKQRQEAVRRRWQASRDALRTRNWKQGGAAGTANPQSQWVAILAVMQPGRWYGTRVLKELTGVRKPMNDGAKWAIRLFVDRARNPNYRPGFDWRVHQGFIPEPQWLWRLNDWGVALRAQVLDSPADRTEPIKIMELDGARPDEWQRARMAKRGNRGVAGSGRLREVKHLAPKKRGRILGFRCVGGKPKSDLSARF